MVKIGYLECPTGIAGDMCLGALIDGGLPWDYLVDCLRSLGIEQEYQLNHEAVIRNGQSATKVHVHLTHHHHGEDEHHHHHSRHLPEIQQLIANASIPERVKRWSQEIFHTLAIAESQVHGIPPEQVHFHEVGATDAIVDIVGTCIGLDWFDIEHLYCSAMPTGGGTVKAAHGLLSVPVPAVVKLWSTRQIPVYSNGIHQELVTPTGAAIAVTLAQEFGEPPPMKLTKIGLGAGGRDLAIPNILRLWLGEAIAQPEMLFERETITVLETQIDDLSPQAIAYTLEQLLVAGALDVFTQSIGMKKSRQGILLTVICHPEIAHSCQAIIFRETTTLGIRERNQSRVILPRHLETVETQLGRIKIKIATRGQNKDSVVNIQPEYEDCARLARQHNLPWREVAQMALEAYHDAHQS
ncbi:MAG: nickel pincer cofactor biosynthesis protein LarC [Cyanobacteria bacterium J06623_7]